MFKQNSMNIYWFKNLSEKFNKHLRRQYFSQKEHLSQNRRHALRVILTSKISCQTMKLFDFAKIRRLKKCKNFSKLPKRFPQKIKGFTKSWWFVLPTTKIWYFIENLHLMFIFKTFSYFMQNIRMFSIICRTIDCYFFPIWFKFLTYICKKQWVSILHLIVNNKCWLFIEIISNFNEHLLDFPSTLIIDGSISTVN